MRILKTESVLTSVKQRQHHVSWSKQASWKGRFRGEFTTFQPWVNSTWEMYLKGQRKRILESCLRPLETWRKSPCWGDTALWWVDRCCRSRCRSPFTVNLNYKVTFSTGGFRCLGFRYTHTCTYPSIHIQSYMSHLSFSALCEVRGC